MLIRLSRRMPSKDCRGSQKISDSTSDARDGQELQFARCFADEVSPGVSDNAEVRAFVERIAREIGSLQLLNAVETLAIELLYQCGLNARCVTLSERE